MNSRYNTARMRTITKYHAAHVLASILESLEWCLPRNHPANHVLDPISRLLLHLLEAHHPTSLALHVLNQPTQHSERLRASCFWATIHGLFMNWAFDVTVQAVQGGEDVGAEIALVSVAIPGAVGRHYFDAAVVGHHDHGARDDIIAV